MGIYSEIVTVDMMFKKIMTLFIPSYIEIHDWDEKKEKQYYDILNITKHAKENYRKGPLEHFIGTFVLKVDSNNKRTSVCDSHNRIITIYIILIALHHSLLLLDHDEAKSLSKSIYEDYILNLYERPILSFSNTLVNDTILTLIYKNDPLNKNNDSNIMKMYHFFKDFFNDYPLERIKSFLYFLFGSYVNLVYIKDSQHLIFI